MTTVLAFFGEQDEIGPDVIAQIGPDPMLLPLDAAAIGIAARSGLSYVQLNEWLGEGSLLEARKLARHLETKWFLAGERDFTIDGVCWPAIDQHAMHWFWQSFTLATALAESVRDRESCKLAFFRGESRRPGLFYYVSDVCQAIWGALLPGQAVALPLRPAAPGPERFAAKWKRRLRRVLKLQRKAPVQPTATGGLDYRKLASAVVFAFNVGEGHRFSALIEDLRAALPGSLGAALLTADEHAASQLTEKWSIPVLPGPPSSKVIDPSVITQFRRATAASMDAIAVPAWKDALCALDFHFAYFSDRRWPGLVSQFEFWDGLWRTHRPAAVITSALFDAESQIPAEAARCRRIPTFAVPHGAVMRPDNLIVSDHICYSSGAMRSVFERSGVPSARFVATRGLYISSEYEAVPGKFVLAGSGCSQVLILTENIGHDGCLAHYTRPGRQIHVLRELGSPPKDLVNRVVLQIKTHPWKKDMELIEAADPLLLDKVLPADTDLHSLLQHVDLVVALNYSGSALFHVLRARKPVVFLWNDAEAETFIHGDVFLAAGPLARTAGEFWEILRCFVNEPAMAEKMQAQADAFRREYLDDGGYRSLAEVIERRILAPK